MLYRVSMLVTIGDKNRTREYVCSCANESEAEKIAIEHFLAHGGQEDCIFSDPYTILLPSEGVVYQADY